ncbi:MAG: 30S ribosomal protein S2 [Patescibacteria group bacterium]|nr:30S ribosomal protein S2 [Patescibacteria group bacterium]
MEKKKETIDMKQIEKMFEVGAHYAYTKTKRHPSTKSFIFGNKNGTELFDLEKTSQSLEDAKNFIKETLAGANKQVLFVGSKSEVKDTVKETADKLEMPSVTNRWVGGTLTNFDEIKKRAEKYQKLIDEREKGDLSKYTKKERGKIDKEILKLERKFSGIVSMKTLPAILFVVDSKYESIAVEEARQKNIPVVALVNSDCDIKKIDYPILANDSVCESVKFFVEEVASVFKTGVVKTGTETKK